MFRRIQDTLRTLFGRTEAQYELARMRAQWSDLLVDVTSMLEKLNTMAARFEKREARAREAADKAQLEIAPTTPLDHKTDLYAKARRRRHARGNGGQPPSDQRREA